MTLTRLDARQLLLSLVGRTIHTITGRPNTILEVRGDTVIVGTSSSPQGAPVEIAEIEAALSRLYSEGEIVISVENLDSHRSALIGAVLAQVPGATTATRPARVRLPVGRPRPWDILPGETIRRTELHALHGGNRQRGISPSSETPNVLIFSDPASGVRHGYMDFWDGETLHYYGEGQRGDQRMTDGNKAILEHMDQGRVLRLFEGAGGDVKYLGVFELDEEEPFYQTDAPQTGSQALRKAIVFKLRPVDTSLAIPSANVTMTTLYRRASVAPIAGDIQTPDLDPDVIDRGRQAHVDLQNQLADFVTSLGAEVLSPGALDPSFDVAWRLGGTLFVAEVKSMTAANETPRLRLGLGQVLHYRHLLARQGNDATPVLLVEREPTDAGWTELCANHGVILLWPDTMSTVAG